MKYWSSNNISSGTISAIISALLFGVCVPFAKLLEQNIPCAALGGFLYLGAGVGLFITILFKKNKKGLNLTIKELPYIAGMVILDISAIVLLMFGILYTTGSNASLLGNLELAATSLIACLLFKEKISKKLWFSIFIIITACMILSFEGKNSIVFNYGSILVILSAIFWGLENNFTKKLSIKDTRQITVIKGVFSGVGGLVIAHIIRETMPEIKYIFLALLLGFISYGVSVSLYIYAQRYIGAAKTATYFALAPFFGVLFSLFILKEIPNIQFYIALLLMLTGTILVIRDSKNS